MKGRAYRVNRASRNPDGTYTFILELRRKWQRRGLSGWTGWNKKYVLGQTGGELHE
jgi:hypothetical protein